MGAIDIMVPAGDVRRLHLLVAERLAAKGHDVALVGTDTAGLPRMLDCILSFERKALGVRVDSLLKRVMDASLAPARPDATLRIDLRDAGGVSAAAPVLKPGFVGCASFAEAARRLMSGHLPDLEITLDGRKRVGYAAPMVDSRLSVIRGLNDVLARMVTLTVSTVERFFDGKTTGRDLLVPTVKDERPTSGQMLGAYALSTMPRQAAGAVKRLGFHVHHWHVSYRFHNGRRVADTGLLAGEPWTPLPDDGSRFYADPFPFEWQGRYFIFVEEFPHGDSKAVISVAEILRDGAPTVPRMVLEEAYHLSYPQVFSRDGEIWMLPERGSGGNLVLYRAESFPDRWVRHSVLIPDREIFDATLLEHKGRLWLFATERDGHGSASDMLVVYHATSLQGPWVPHPCNPVTIDRAAARPGGRFVRVGDRIMLPLQDGSENYGGGLGLADLVELDETKVRLTRPVPILASDRDPYPKIHTLNSSEHIEVIDCIAQAPRGPLRKVL